MTTKEERGQGLRLSCNCTLYALEFSFGLMKLLDFQLEPKLEFQIINVLKNLKCNN